jgi:hypothetical protein
MSCDFTALVLQGAGGGIAATAGNADGVNAGRYIMIAGMVVQVISLLTFMALWLEFILRVRNAPESVMYMKLAVVRNGGRFRWFMRGKLVADEECVQD